MRLASVANTRSLVKLDARNGARPATLSAGGCDALFDSIFFERAFWFLYGLCQGLGDIETANRRKCLFDLFICESGYL